MHILIGLIITFFFVILVIRNPFFQLEHISKRIVVVSMIVKIVASIFCWYIYTFYYTDLKVNDIYKYFNDGITLHNLAVNSPSNFLNLIFGQQVNSEEYRVYLSALKFWFKPNSNGIYNDNQTIIIVNFLMSFFSNKSIVLQSIWFGFIGFLGNIMIFKSTSSYLPISLRRVYFFIIFFLPSTLIWTSGIFKETLIYFSIGSIFYFGKSLIDKKFKSSIFCLFGFSLLLLMAVKPYFFIFFLSTLIIYLIAYFLNTKNVKRVYLLSLGAFILFFICWSKFHNPVVFNMKNKTRKEQIVEYNKVNSKSYQNNVLGNDLNLLEILRFKQADYYYEAKQANAKSLIYINKLDGTLENLFLNIPTSLINGILRPFPFDLTSMIFIPFFLENVILMFLIICIIIAFKKVDKSYKNEYYLMLYFVIITLIFIGLLVPIIGNIVRYRAPIIPLLYFLIFLHLDSNMILKRGQQLKRFSIYKNTNRQKNY